jgi:hypothetical protein
MSTAPALPAMGQSFEVALLDGESVEPFLEKFLWTVARRLGYTIS